MMDSYQEINSFRTVSPRYRNTRRDQFSGHPPQGFLAHKKQRPTSRKSSCPDKHCNFAKGLPTIEVGDKPGRRAGLAPINCVSSSKTNETLNKISRRAIIFSTHVFTA